MSQPHQPNQPNQNPQNPSGQPQYPPQSGGGQPQYPPQSYPQQPGGLQPQQYPQPQYGGQQYPPQPYAGQPQEYPQQPYAGQQYQPNQPQDQPQQYPQGGYQGGEHPNPYQVPSSSIQPEQGVGSKLGKALVIGIGAMLLGALVWGALAYFTESYFVFVALLVGFAVSYALTSPFKKPLSNSVLATMILPGIILTVLSLELGNLLALTFLAMKAGATFGEAFSIATSLFSDLMTSSDGLMTAFFGLLGAGLSFFQLVRKR